MTTVTVAAVLLGLAVPSFSRIVRSNQIAAQSNELMASLALARSEAMKRAMRVSVCPVDNPNDPAAVCAANWNAGWIMFTDDFGVGGVRDPADNVIQVFPAVDNGVNVVGPVSVIFSRIGRSEFSETFTVTKQGCSTNDRRQIAVGMSGRISLQRDNCP